MSENGAIHWRSFGGGPDRALAIHCTLAHSGAWRGVGQALSDLCTLHAYDLPCHGKSADWDRQGDLHDACTAPARIWLDTPAHVIGHSFGATIALRLAVEQPEKVLSLTLIEPVYFAAARVHDPAAFERYQKNAGYMRALEEGDFALAARLFNRDWGDGTRWDALPEGGRNYMIDRMWFVPHQSPMITEDGAALLAPGRMERANMPVLLLKGARSRSIIETVHDALATRLPDTRQVTLPGAGHMGPITHPEATASAIRGFLEMA